MLKTNKKNEKNTQKECQGRQTKRLQNEKNRKSYVPSLNDP